MQILVTGNLGYIGIVLVKRLKERGFDVVGLDVDYFHGCELTPFNGPDRQLFKDLREISKEDLRGCEGVIHLAALSNDPLGEVSPSVTHNINFLATKRLLELSMSADVKRFVYASSQSMYGIADLSEELDEDRSKKNPLTAYAKAKWSVEQWIAQQPKENDLDIVCFRPSTVFGAAPRLRCDIVFNNLVASGFTTGKIEIKSDGSPWRPVVHVEDVCSALISGIEAPADLVSGEAFNVGNRNGNYTVEGLAIAAAHSVPGCDLVFTGEHTDPRSYKVSFEKIHSRLGEFFKPSWTLNAGGEELVNFFLDTGFTEKKFRGAICNRLQRIKELQASGKVNKRLERLS